MLVILSVSSFPALAVSKVDDVRPVLQYYSQFDDPLAQFHENQLKLKVQLCAPTYIKPFSTVIRSPCMNLPKASFKILSSNKS